MSTFFEKLTGAHDKSVGSETVDLSTLREVTPRVTVARAKTAVRPQPQLHHLKVADETMEVPQVAEVHEPDEEGELTVDIFDKGDSIVIQSTVAGVKPEDLDISITNDTVTIRGRRERTEEVRDENYYYKELFWGTFSRSVILPEEIEDDEAEASLKHGLLTIRLPKKRRGVVQKLKVKIT